MMWGVLCQFATPLACSCWDGLEWLGVSKVDDLQSLGDLEPWMRCRALATWEKPLLQLSAHGVQVDANA